MLAAGDELGHTQGGNNNPYCQDNRITWIDWAGADEALIGFTAELIALRQRLTPLGHHWLSGLRHESGASEVTWWHPEGREMHATDWQESVTGGLGALLQRRADATALLWLANPGAHDQAFHLPAGDWQVLLDTSATVAPRSLRTSLTMPARCLLLASTAA
jgi:glycogen operon protein